MNGDELVTIRGLGKTYRIPVGSAAGGAFEMPFSGLHFPWRQLTAPGRFAVMMARAPFRALAGIFGPGRDVKALDNLNLGIRRGEVFGLLGPNGAGKTTTIGLLLGLIWPTTGSAYIFGLPPTDLEARRKLGYLPEETYLYRHLSAEETLFFYGRLFGLDRRILRRRVDELLDIVGLDTAARRRPLKTYSKGMARRIGLAQALINDPDLIILDEPTSGLDPVGSLQMKDLILRLKAAGKTILMSSHLLADVEDCCDRIAILYRGKVQVEGRVDELLAVKDVFQLQARGIGPATVERLREIITESGGSLEGVGYQRTRLETLFRDLILRRHEEESRSAQPTSAS